MGGGGGRNKQGGGGLKNSVKYKKQGGWNKRGALCLFCSPNDANVSKFAYVRKKAVICVKGKKC